MNYQDELEKQQREQKLEEYLQLLEEERKQKEHEKAEIIKELVKNMSVLTKWKKEAKIGLKKATSNKSAQAVLATRHSITLKRSSALRQQSESSSPARLAMPSWITTAMDNDTEMREAEAKDFDPFEYQYAYTTGYDVHDSYDDP